jgi:hypothetical protein
MSQNMLQKYFLGRVSGRRDFHVAEIEGLEHVSRSNRYARDIMTICKHVGAPPLRPFFFNT